MIFPYEGKILIIKTHQEEECYCQLYDFFFF